MSDRMPVDGPHRVYVQRAPSGVELDVSHLVGKLLVQLAQDFVEDPKGIGAELTEIAEADSAARTQTYSGDEPPAAHERDALVGELLEQIGGGRLRVYGSQAAALADAVWAAAAPAPVRGGRAA